MANEATIRLRISDPIPFTVANATGIEKGTLLALTEPRTVAANSGGGGQVFGGILAREKIASDGHTNGSVFYDGIFDIKLDTNATCIAGDFLILSGTNTVAAAKNWSGTASALYLSGMIVGMALETGSSAEVIQTDIGRKR